VVVVVAWTTCVVVVAGASTGAVEVVVEPGGWLTVVVGKVGRVVVASELDRRTAAAREGLSVT